MSENRKHRMMLQEARNAAKKLSEAASNIEREIVFAEGVLSTKHVSRALGFANYAGRHFLGITEASESLGDLFRQIKKASQEADSFPEEDGA